MKIINQLLAIGLVFTAVTSLAKSGQIEIKVVGGQDAAQGEFPFIVSLQENSMGHFCGGSLIKSHWVLTAGHCVTDTTIDQIVIGMQNLQDTSNTEVMKVKQIIRHPQYNADTTDYDFALIELDKDSKYAPVPLNTTDIAIPASGQPVIATVAGWGVTNENSYNLPNLLQKVEVPLVSQDVCNKDYNGVITDRMLCAGYAQGGKDACQGDSGGPLVATGSDGSRHLIGVVSWGQGCARANLPGVYSKVSAAAAWINQTAQ